MFEPEILIGTTSNREEQVINAILHYFVPQAQHCPNEDLL